MESDAVPFLSNMRYKDPGLRKRRIWEQAWDLQRQEDAINARTKLLEGDPNRLTEKQVKKLRKKEVGDIPVPPKYKPSDFRSSTYWRMRGKLDVPKERFILCPHTEREADPTPVIGWAGWDHLQQTRALAAYYQARKTQDGWSPERLILLLAAIQELLPWLKQWHNDLNPDYDIRMGDYFQAFVENEARELGVTLDELRACRPPKTQRFKTRRRDTIAEIS